MRMSKILILSLVVVVIFIAGVLVGNTYNVTDFLCPSKAYPHKLEHDIVSKNGVLFPKGTVIPIRNCAYMQRFKWQFAIDKATSLEPNSGQPEGDYGFSELYPINEIKQ